MVAAPRGRVVSIGDYLWSSYRRKSLDRLQERFSDLYRGVVLDMGGRDRGRFRKPRERVDRWIFADINREHQPDLVLDVSDMQGKVADRSVDVVNAMELFEHVERIDRGLEECYRVLKPEGRLLISVPFLYPVHADPFDFQRWTGEKWRRSLEALGFRIEVLDVTGGFFSVFGDAVKTLVHALPRVPCRFLQLFYPLLDLFVLLDRTGFGRRHPRLAGYHGGYFIVARKEREEEKGERRKEKGERIKGKGERRKERGERRKEKGIRGKEKGERNKGKG